MTTDVERVRVRIEGDMSGLRSTLVRASSETDKKTSAISRAFAGVEKRMTGVGLTAQTFIGGLTVGALIQATRASLDFADSLIDQSKVIDMSVERLQALRHVGQQLGVEIPQLDKGLEKFTVTIGDAAEGELEAVEVFKRLGVEIRDTNGQVRSTEAIFDDTVDAFSRFESVAQRNALAAQIFGEQAGPKMGEMLGIGAAGLKEQENAAREAGAVMNKETIDAAGALKDEIAALANVAKTQGAEALITSFGPAVALLAHLASAAATNVNEMVQGLALLGGVGPLANGSIEKFNDEIEDTSDRIQTLKALLANGPKGSGDFIASGLRRGDAQRELNRQIVKLEQLKAAQMAAIEAANKPTPGAAGAGAGGGAAGADLGASSAPVEESSQARLSRMVEEQREVEESIAEHNERQIAENAKKNAEKIAADEAYVRQWHERVLEQQEIEEEIGEFNEQQLAEERARSDEYVELWWDRVEQQMEAEQALADFEAQQNRERLGAAKTALGNLSTLMASENRKMFEAGKAAAIAETIINTYEAAQKAFTSLADIPYVGPALGAAAAAAAIAGGLARVQAIKNTSFGSRSVAVGVGNGVAVGSGGSAAGGGAAGATAPRQNIYIQGLNPNDLYSGSAIRSLIERISEAQGDGTRIAVVS